jgi:thiol-disulfide isomerase/thioredoxin
MDPHRTPALERPLVRGAIALVLLLAIGGTALIVRAVGDGGDGGAPVSVGGAPTSDATAAADPETGALDNRAPIVGQPAPDFVLRDLNGQLVQLSDLRGSVVWINFWASWCRPCKQELPEIQKLYDEKRGEGLVVLAVNWKDSESTAAAYGEDLGLGMPVLLDRRSEVFDQYKLQGLPDSFFIDREGNLAALHFGYLTAETMRKRLESAGLP